MHFDWKIGLSWVSKSTRPFGAKAGAVAGAAFVVRTGLMTPPDSPSNNAIEITIRTIRMAQSYASSTDWGTVYVSSSCFGGLRRSTEVVKQILLQEHSRWRRKFSRRKPAGYPAPANRVGLLTLRLTSRRHQRDRSVLVCIADCSRDSLPCGELRDCGERRSDCIELTNLCSRTAFTFVAIDTRERVGIETLPII